MRNLRIPHLKLSLLVPKTEDSHSDLQSPTPEPLAALCTSAAKFFVSVINPHAVGLLSCLLHCHLGSTICSGFIQPSSSFAQAADVTSNSASADPLPFPSKGCAITGIFSLCNDKGKINPIAFYICMLSSAELNYDTHNLPIRRR